MQKPSYDASPIEVEAFREAAAKKVLEAIKAKGAQILYPTTTVHRNDLSHEVYDDISELFGTSGTFRTVPYFTTPEVVRFSGVMDEEWEDSAADALNELVGYNAVFVISGTVNDTILCFWTDENQFPGGRAQR